VRVFSGDVRKNFLIFYIAFGIVFEPFCLMVTEVGYYAERMHIPFIVSHSDIEVLDLALSSYRRDVGSYPTSEQGLRALLVDSGVRGWAGPYVRGDSPLGWGRLPYLYRPRLQGKPEILWLGMDGKAGGRGDDQDISNLHLDDPMLPSLADWVSVVGKITFVLLGPICGVGYLFLPWLIGRRRRLKAD
jgi:type II secretion system protein G